MTSHPVTTSTAARAVSCTRSFAGLLATAAIAVLTAIGLPMERAHAHLVDDFARADSATVGNGWIEKNAAAFSLVGGEVAKGAVSSGYVDNVVYRPNIEDVLDVESAVEFRLLSLPPGYPQVLVRIQSASAATAGTLNAYMLYVEDNASRAILGRQTGTAFVTTLATLNLTTPLNTTDRFRLRLSARGTNPVQLAGYVERLNSGVWEVIGQASASDSAANRIATAGSVGFSGYIESNYLLDNFARVDLGAVGTANPAPAATGLAPASATAGESGLTVIVYGSGFTTDSVVRWNGSNRTTTYISPSELEAAITTADLAVATSAAITVSNPAPGGSVSAARTFQVTPPGVAAPTLTSLAPSSATAGGAAFTLTVNGANYNAGSVVRWNGADRTTTFVSATQLQAAITAADIATAGTAAVTVRRPSDGLVSGSQNFTINAAAVAADFTDNFNRADSANIGNSWIEKAATAFSIVANEVAKVSAGASDYRNNIVYRPASEDALDVESAIEFRLLSTPVGYPLVMARAQSSTIATTNTLDAYLLYMTDSTTQATLSRQRGSGYDTLLATLNLSSALNTSDRYRLRLRTTGTNPVQLSAYVERLSGGTWQVLAQATFSDSASDRIATAGSVGFAGYTETSYRFDNFSRTNLGAPNPAPATSGLTPSSASAGSAALNITVNGSNFVNGSVVRWNGSDRLTSFVSASQLTAQLNAADLAAQGSGSVTVFNPAPAGGTSNAQTFTITAPANNPAPATTSVSPTSATAGGAAFTLTVNGSNFVAGSVVRWNGNSRTTTYNSVNQLTAQINAADIASAGSASVTVFNPTPGGGTSAAQTFTISAPSNPVPAITGLNPASASEGTPAFTLSVFGTGFVNGSTVRWNGSNRTTTFVSSTQVNAAIAAADILTSGNRTVTVFSPTPGGGTSNNATFSVSVATPTNPVPTLTQINPLTIQPGSSAFTLTVNGSGFTSQSVIQWNGQARTTTYVSGSQLTTTIPGGDVASAGLGAVTVTTPAPGGGVSTPLTLFVQDASAGLFFDGFNRPDAAAVGNGWTEKNPAAFAIQGNQLVSFDTTNGFQDDIMYRPVGEARLDVESSVEFTRLSTQPGLENSNLPQLHSRVQNMTDPATLDSYIFFMEDVQSNRATFAVTRSFGSGNRWECYLADFPLAQSLIEGQRYRLRFRVSGTAPVTLTGIVDRFVSGAWQTIGSGSTTHDANTPRSSLYCDYTSPPPPITTAGTMGVAKWVNRTDNYDNFYWRDLGPAAPVAPVITGLNPATTTAGGAAFQLVVNGSGFTSGSTVRWNGSNRTTTFVSSSELRASITAADIATAGTASITVQLPNSGLISNASSFEIASASAGETLVDGFARADNAAIGNGWIEKTPSAFSIVNGRAQKQGTPSGDYRDNIVYRPSSEDVLNAEASVEMRLQSLPVGYPQVMVRVQANTVTTPNRFDGYLLFMSDSSTTATLSRQAGTGYDTVLTTLPLSQALNTTDNYRLRLRATGTNPVQLTAYVERQNGSAWEVLGQGSYSDNSASRISTAGSVAFGGYVESNYSFDNFRRTYLGP